MEVAAVTIGTNTDMRNMIDIVIAEKNIIPREDTKDLDQEGAQGLRKDTPRNPRRQNRITKATTRSTCMRYTKVPRAIFCTQRCRGSILVSNCPQRAML